MDEDAMDEDDMDDMDEDDMDEEPHSVTLLNRYLHQDRFFEQPRNESYYLHHIPADFDDRIRYGNYSLTQYEIESLRENRNTAMILYGRMVFREMLLSQTVDFRGDVRYCDAIIPKREWSQLMSTGYQEYADTVNIIMYEFVIRGGSAISPAEEINLFGFIKEVRTVYNSDDRYRFRNDDNDWENLHEYVFVADVFTVTEFYVRDLHGNQYVECYGNYNMTEGTISPVEMFIPFSQIRRLYRMRGCERVNYQFTA